MSKKFKKKSDEVGRMCFVGSILLGLGIGLLYGRPDAGVLIGLGVGFIIYATVKFKIKK